MAYQNLKLMTMAATRTTKEAVRRTQTPTHTHPLTHTDTYLCCVTKFTKLVKIDKGKGCASLTYRRFEAALKYIFEINQK